VTDTPVGELFHVCLVTAELEVTMDALTRTVGTRWTDPVSSRMPVRLENGEEAVYRPRVTYSTTFPHLELHEARPGTALAAVPGGGVHHLGYWVADLAGGIAELASRGYRPEVVGSAPAGASAPAPDVGAFRPQVFAYLIAPAGHRVELVDVSVRPQIEAWLRGEPPI
jgi:hypothetical protein